MNSPRPHLIIGLGNEFIGDDGAGILCLRALRHELTRRGLADRFDFVELAVGGMALLDHLLGYSRCTIIDAVLTGMHPPGTLYRIRFKGSDPARHVSTSHQIDYSLMLALSNLIAAPAPRSVSVFGVEAQELGTFGAPCSDAVSKALPHLVSFIITDLVSPNAPAAGSTANDSRGSWELLQPGTNTPLTMEYVWHDQ